MATQTKDSADAVLKDLHPYGKKRARLVPKAKKRKAKRGKRKAVSGATKGSFTSLAGFEPTSQRVPIAAGRRPPDGVERDPDAPLAYNADWRRTKKLRGSFK